MRTIFTGSSTCSDEQGEKMKMDYYITVKEIGLQSFGIESYGIRIEQERNGTKIPAQCDDITCSSTEIDLLAHVMREGAVTPVALDDVVSDWV